MGFWCGDKDVSKQKRGSVLDLVLAPALLLGPSLLTARRRHGIQIYGTPFQQVP
jgi:hypothetical protein